jgi:hypothetical protein
MAAKLHKPVICFREIVRDSLTYIDVQVGNTRKAQQGLDSIEWQVLNQTSKAMFVAVVDFWAFAGGTPFTDGDIPRASPQIPANSQGTIQTLKAGKPVKTDGDAAVYKYTVLYTTDGSVDGNTIWTLGRDPELEIEPV